MQMTKDDIITLPNGHLRQKSEKVREIDEATLALIQEMTDAAIDWEASRPHEISAALAAVQIDKLQRTSGRVQQRPVRDVRRGR